MSASGEVQEKWNLTKVHEISKDDVKLRNFLEARNFLPKERACNKCGRLMIQSVTEGSWRCRGKIVRHKQKAKYCSYSQSIWKGTLFSKTKLSKPMVLKLTYMLVRNHLKDDIDHELMENNKQLSSSTITNWRRLVKKVMEGWAITCSERIGGPGKVVQIEESQVVNRKYIKDYRKKQRVANAEDQWFFGGVERDSGKVFLVPLEKRDANTWISIIKECVLPGTMIVSECWNAYHKLGREAYEHLTLNHSVEFAERGTKDTTKSTETAPHHDKRVMPNYDKAKANYPGYLVHSMFLNWCQANSVDPFEKFLDEVSHRNMDIVHEELNEIDDEEVEKEDLTESYEVVEVKPDVKFLLGGTFLD